MLAGFFETQMTLGAINTGNKSTTVEHNFGPSTIWAKPTLQRVVGFDHVSNANADVESFIDGAGLHTGGFFGIWATGCTRVTFRLRVTEAFARVLCTTHFLA